MSYIEIHFIRNFLRNLLSNDHFVDIIEYNNSDSSDKNVDSSEENYNNIAFHFVRNLLRK